MIVKNILNYLEANDMSVTDFAKKCKLKSTTIYSIMSGQTKNPTLEVLTKIARTTNMTLDELTKSEKRDIDEVKKIYDKMKNLNDENKNLVYVAMNAIVDELNKHEKK